jgi:hypothetical protein
MHSKAVREVFLPVLMACFVLMALPAFSQQKDTTRCYFEAKLLEPANRAGCFVNGVDAEMRHRAMSCNSRGLGLEPEGPPVP